MACSGIHPACYLGSVCLQQACKKEYSPHVNAANLQRQQTGAFFNSSVIIFSLTFLVAWGAMIGMWGHQKKLDSKTVDPSSEERSIKRVIILMPVIAVASCILALADPRLGVLVWIVFPLAGRMVKHRQTGKEAQ